MKMPKKEIDINFFAPCGMNCKVCYKHCQNKKPCEGCLRSNEGKPEHCRKCKIKDCVKAKKLNHCYECLEFPCLIIKHLEKSYNKRYGASLIENSNFAKKNGMIKFMGEQKQKYTCPKCGGIISIHDRKCSDCQDKMEYTISLATEKNTEEVLSIYHSLIGKDGCNWDYNYPGIDEIKSDIEKKFLYIVEYNKEVIAVAAAGKDDELIELNCFNKKIKKPCFLARIGVKTKHQNKGLAKYLISYIEKQMTNKGYDGMHFLVSKTNPHALAVYDKMNYKCCGECIMFDKEWFCYEKSFYS